MSKSLFQDMAEQMKPRDEVVAGLLQRLDGTDDVPAAPVAPVAPEPAPTPIRARRPGVRWLAAAACLAVAAGSGVWAIEHPSAAPIAVSPVAATPAAPDVAAGEAEASTVLPVKEYAQLYQAVSAAMTKWQANGYVYGYGVPAERLVLDDRVPAPGTSVSSSYATAGDAGAGQAHSSTNVQVAGIDEGDIVKTDGRLLYVATGTKVAILAPNGSSTRAVASLDTATKGAPVAGAVLDMMLTGDTLVVFVQDYSAKTQVIGGNDPTAYVPYDAAQTKALLYDVSDPAAPKALTSFGQSGSYVTSRLAGNVVYLVTDYALNDPAKIVANDPSTYAPQVSKDAAPVPLDPKDVKVLSNAAQPRYAVASAIDIATRQRLGQQAVLAGADTVYMSQANLYLAAVMAEGKLSGVQRKAAGLPAGSLTATTTVVRIALNDGHLTVAAQGTVPGMPINQFALDENKGKLRIVTDVSGSSGSPLNEWMQRAALYVLDDKLAIIGAVPKLVENEQVRSVRFDGDTGYVVTFRQVDPLFAVDLRKPTKPVVMSALKIPGFSAYLHPWSKGRLLGIGVDADNNGNQNGLKLSMFDTSDPYAVTQATGKHVTADDSAALYDHQAVLVDVDRGLIGFPTMSGSDGQRRYAVYAYSSGDGFALRENLKLPGKADWSAMADAVRGVLVGDYLYVCTAERVDVYDLASLRTQARVAIG